MYHAGMRCFWMIFWAGLLAVGTPAHGAGASGAAVAEYVEWGAKVALETHVGKASRVYLARRLSGDACLSAPASAFTIDSIDQNHMGQYPLRPCTVSYEVIETLKGETAKVAGPFFDAEGELGLGWLPNPAVTKAGSSELRVVLFVDDQARAVHLLTVDRWSGSPVDSVDEEAVSMDGAAIGTKQELLAVIRRAAAFRPTRYGAIPFGRPKEKVEAATEAASSEPAATEGASTAPAAIDPEYRNDWEYILVPADERLEALARGWLAGPDRLRVCTGLYALGMLPSAENAARVRPFLRDEEAYEDLLARPQEDGLFGTPMERHADWKEALSPWSGSRYYPMRILAARALEMMGMPAEEAVLTDPPHAGWWSGGWVVAALLLPPAALWLVCGRVRALRRPWRRVWVLVTALGVALWLLTVDSWWHVHIVDGRVGGWFCDVSIYRGLVRVETLREFPHACRWVYGRFPAEAPAGEWTFLDCALDGLVPDPELGSPEFWRRVAPEIRVAPLLLAPAWHGFAAKPAVGLPRGIDGIASGLAWGPLMRANHPYVAPLEGPYAAQVWRWPLWPVAWVAVLPGFWLGLRGCAGALRRRTRGKQGRCLACGYDLRGSVERCPECGVAFARHA